MLNEEVANVFENMARVLALKGANRFRMLAYERAAQSLREFEGDLAATAREGKLEDIPGIGHDLAAMTEEYIRTGHVRRCERECRGVPPELIGLLDIPGVGPKTLSLLHEKFRVRDFEDFKRVLDTGALLKVPGFGAKKIENLWRGIGLWLAGKERMPLGLALPLAERLLEEARKIELIERIDIAGSVRRRRETVGDFDLLIISRDSPRARRS